MKNSNLENASGILAFFCKAERKVRQKELRSLRFYRLLYSIVAESFRRFSILAKIVLIIEDSLTKEFCVGAYLCKAENCCSLERRSAGVVNRSLGDRLRCLVGDHIANWYQVLPMAEFAYNSCKSNYRSQPLFPFQILTSF